MQRLLILCLVVGLCIGCAVGDDSQTEYSIVSPTPRPTREITPVSTVDARLATATVTHTPTATASVTQTETISSSTTITATEEVLSPSPARALTEETALPSASPSPRIFPTNTVIRFPTNTPIE
jgi:hypothetical protein